MCDPRVKLEFMQYIGIESGAFVQSDIDQYKETFQEIFEQYHAKHFAAKQESDTSSSSEEKTEEEELRNLMRVKRPKVASNHLAEMHTYFKEDICDMEVDPLVWWAANAARFPVVALIARDYLAVPLSSASAERIFSSSADLLNHDRNRMRPELATRCMCLRSWNRLGIF